MTERNKKDKIYKKKKNMKQKKEERLFRNTFIEIISHLFSVYSDFSLF